MRIKGLVLVIFMLWIMSSPGVTDVPPVSGERVTPHAPVSLSADPGVPTTLGPYVIIELTGATIPTRGSSLSTLLTEEGVLHVQYNVSEVLVNADLLDGAQALIIDSSCGSDDGTAVSEEFITLLVRMDLPTILVGRAAWLVHRLRQTSPPVSTAPIDTQLQNTPEYSGAVFLSQPEGLTLGSSLTSETGLTLPVDDIQAERSRLIDLTGHTTPAVLSPLRYESWPLDVFLFGPEDPAQWTGNGNGLLVNTLAYATAPRETALANLFQSLQSKEGQTLAGGLHHSHTPSLETTYLAVHTVHDLMDSGSFAIWRSDNEALVQSILTDLYDDLGTEAGFSESIYDGTLSVDSTSMGLWLVTMMGLGSQFSITKLTNYLSSRQMVEGGFSDHMTVTYHVTEALSQSGGLGAINTVTLESWLRSCVVDGGTGTPDNWGGVARRPTSGESQNIHASEYIMSLWMLGKAHTDPLKLTEWIQDTSMGDGSYTDTINPDMHLTRGTASALTTMSIIGTLDPTNSTTGLAWLAANQLPSGGFGIGIATDDIVAKTWATTEVAICLNELGETSLTTGVLIYIERIKSDVGFEVMEEIPSLMWSYWLSEVDRLTHTGMVDNYLKEDYLRGFEGTAFIQYPGHSNLSVLSAPEYDNQQYYHTGVWAQFFGAGLADSADITLTLSHISYVTLYLSLRQDTGGHYRPSVMGAPHMQYTVAAVEALYQLDELDTIWYRPALESEVLSLYSSGSWNPSGWDLAPYTGVQPAIDYLSTHTALRLGLITPTMATEIASTVESRLQYSDLWALSWDVKTLALLNSSLFSLGMESVDSDAVLSALGSAFVDGWYSSSTLWQPVYTAGVLDLVSILGLRLRMNAVGGSTLSGTIPSSVQLGDTLDIGVSITSNQPTHSVFVHVYDSWTLFENVGATDTLSLLIPSDVGAIGTQDISLVVWDYGMSRAYDSGSTEVLGSMEGTLTVHTPNVVRGDPILGTVSWTLSGGGDAGDTNVNIRLSNGSYYNDWVSTEQSPYDISIPTDSLGEGPYNLIVTLSRSGCDDLVLWQAVSISQPEDTFISSSTPLTGGVGNETLIPFSLHMSNGSTLAGQTVHLTVWDGTMSAVHSDSMLSVDGVAYFSWTHGTRGHYSFNLHFARNGVLMESGYNGTLDVYEQPSILIQIPDDPVAPSVTPLTVSVMDSGSQGIPGVSLHTVVTLDGAVILDSMNVTTGDGSVTFILRLDSPGGLVVTVSVPAQGLLLDSTNQTSHTVYADTTLVLSLPGQPIEQGTTLGISVLMLDWTGSPLIGTEVQITVSWYNGTVIKSNIVYTGVDGTCSTSHQFTYVGDFWVNASYTGSGLNVSASDSVIQRVRVTPTMIVIHDPTVNVGGSTEFLVAIQDNLGQYIEGRTLFFSITMSGATVFQTQVTSVNGLAAIYWSPTERGIALISLVHSGDVFYEANSTDTSMSVMVVVSATLDLDLTEVDLYGTVTLTYTLVSTGDVVGIDIIFQVLGMDLVPVWTVQVLTDRSGIASTTYLADDVHGVLRVTAAPAEDQFMLGGDNQADLTVMTYAHVVTDLLPEPPSVGQPTNATVMVTDDLGLPIDGLTVRIYVYDIYYDPLFAVNRVTVNGMAYVEFTPTQWGAYRVGVSSNGMTSVHSFTETGPDTHTVYCPTTLMIMITDSDIEVGDTLSISAQLLNVYGNPLVGMDVNLSIVGDSNLGPVTLVTNATGHVYWEIAIGEQGFWTVDAEFFGLATYLPMTDSMEVHSSYGTSVTLELQNDGDVVAGLTPLNVTVLLTDSGGTPLEGRTIVWEAHHSLHGLMDSGSVIQLGVEPEVIEILLLQGGNYTVIFSFAGSDHYHSSNAALDIIVKGTTTVVLDGSTDIDRASAENLTVSVIDELGTNLDIDSLTIEVSLTNASGEVSMTSWSQGSSLYLSFYGLDVGDYSLNITITDTAFQTGSVLMAQLKVITQSELETVSSDLSGVVGQDHSITLRLVDSLNDTMEGMTVWVSLYRPDGSEVYGTIGDVTPIDLVDGLAEISWNPSWTGNYTLIVQYVGDEWRLPTAIEMDILTRRLTTLTTDALDPVDYLQDVTVEATLTSTLSSLGGAEVSVTVILNGSIVLDRTVITSSRGVASTVLEDLEVGEYTVRIHYAGTDSLAPCTVELELSVRPIVSATLTTLTQPYVGSNCTIEIITTVSGVDTDWRGNIVLTVYDPQDTLLLNQTLSIGPHFELMLYMVLGLDGQHTVNMTILDLPVLEISTSELHFTAIPVPISIVLDAGTTPVVAGVPIMAIIGFVLRRRLGGTIEGLPTEWGGA